MKTYTAMYCGVNEDTGELRVEELQAPNFVEAAKIAVHKSPPDMKLYQLEEQPGQMGELIELPPPEVARAGNTSSNRRQRRKWRDKP